MKQEIELLEKWKRSLPKENVITNEYSIDDKTVILTATRCIGDSDPGKSMTVVCALDMDSIIAAITKLSTNREQLNF